MKLLCKIWFIQQKKSKFLCPPWVLLTSRLINYRDYQINDVKYERTNFLHRNPKWFWHFPGTGFRTTLHTSLSLQQCSGVFFFFFKSQTCRHSSDCTLKALHLSAVKTVTLMPSLPVHHVKGPLWLRSNTGPGPSQTTFPAICTPRIALSPCWTRRLWRFFQP